MHDSPRARPLDFFWLSLVWLAGRALPIYWLASSLDRKFFFDAQQAAKLIEYGFWERNGALLHIFYLTGHMAPEIVNSGQHNYAHHPLPLFWVYSFLYWIGGNPAIYIFVALLGLATCLLVYGALAKWLGRTPALWASALYILSHAAIEYDLNTCTVAQGIFVWPVALLIISRPILEKRAFSRGEYWLLGLTMFLAGQVSWFALATAPSLLLFALPEDVNLASALRNPFRFPAWRALFIGAIVSLVVFLLQVYCYGPKTEVDPEYIREQVGNTGAIPRLNPVVVLRMLLTGPALWLAALCLLARTTFLTRNRLFAGSLLYIAVFAISALILPGWIGRNQDPYRYLAFPIAALTALAFVQFKGLWLKVATLAAALPALAFCYSKLQVVAVASEASVRFGNWVASQSKRTDVVLTNRKQFTKPVRPDDIEFKPNTRYVADRMLLFDATDKKEAARAFRPLAEQRGDIFFLRDLDQPLSPDLEALLVQSAIVIARTNLVVPPEPPSLYSRFRGIVYSKLYRPEFAPASKPEPSEFSLELYRLMPAATDELLRTARQPRDKQASLSHRRLPCF